MSAYCGSISDPTLKEATLLAQTMRATRILNRHPSQWIAYLAPVVAGLMSFINLSNAEGLAPVDIEITLKDEFGNDPVWVGLGILLYVYALIISEVVHKRLAVVLVGISSILALNQYKSGAVLTLVDTNILIEWENIGLLLRMMIMISIISHTEVFNGFLYKLTSKAKKMP